MFNCTKVASAAHSVPEQVVTCEEMEEKIGFGRLNLRKGMAKLLSGVSERRIAEKGTNASDLAAEAGKLALCKAGLKSDEIDLVIFASVSQDLIEPATANIVMDKMGIRNGKGFDVKNACNAVLCSIEIADLFIKQGKAHNALIVSGEVLSLFIKSDFEDMEQLKNVNATFSVGDAGGAIVLQSYQCDETKENVLAKFKSFPDTWKDGALLGGGTMYPRDPEKMYAQNEAPELMKLNFKRATEFYQRVIEEWQIDFDDIKLFVPPQITKYIVTKVVETLGLPEDRVVCHVNSLGNISTAASLVALSMAIDNKKISLGNGDKVLLFGAANGFSAGVLCLTL